MKKVLPVLVLTSFLTVLMAPMAVLAAECGNCVTPPTNAAGGCTCGANVLTQESGLYCYNGTVYSSQSACIAAAGGSTTGATGDYQFLLDIADRVKTVITIVAGSIAAVMVVVAGFLFLTAAGNQNTIGTARKMLIWALVGLAIVLLAQALVALVRYLVGA